MEQIIIVLVFGAIALLNRWLSKNKDEGEGEDPVVGEEDSSKSQQEGRLGRETAEEERVRKFMEALGVPRESLPPLRKPPAPRNPAPAHRQAPESQRGRLPEIRPPHPTREIARPAPAPARRIKEPKVFPAPAAAPEPPAPARQPIAAQSQVQQRAPVPATAGAAALLPGSLPMRPEAGVRTLLRSRNSAREAVLLREILGPPRGLQQPRQNFATPF